MQNSNENWNISQIGWKGFLKQLYGHHKPEGGVLILRLVIGILFISAGWHKVSDISATITGFASLGFTPFQAYLVAWVELLGGLLLVLGILIKPTCVALATVMAVAVFGTPFHPRDIYFGHDYQFILLVFFLALYIMGPGKYSLAHLWLKRKERMVSRG